MDNNVNYNVGDVYNNRIVTRISVSRQMNPRRKNRFGHYIEWKDIKTGKVGKCNFGMFGENHPMSTPQRGVNDIATVAPWMVSWLKDQSIAYTHMVTSKHMVDWICPYCKSEVRNRTICNCYRYKKVTCPYCSDGVSYPERFLANMLKSINVCFDFQREFSWSDGKFYDFYIPSLNMIIETHGKQHYTNTWSTGVDKNQKMTIQDNDSYKHMLATKHGVSCYVVLDCRCSDGDYIRQSILDSELNTLFDLSSVIWNDISIKSSSSVFIQAIDMFRSNIDGYTILNELPVSAYTLNRYVKKAKKMGLLSSDFQCSIPWNIPFTQETKEKVKSKDDICNILKYATYEQAVDSKINKLSLTKNDVETACWLIYGVAPKDLATLIKVSYDVVCSRRSYLYKKLKIHSNAELCKTYENDVSFRNIIDAFYIQNQHILSNE